MHFRNYLAVIFLLTASTCLGGVNIDWCSAPESVASVVFRDDMTSVDDPHTPTVGAPWAVSIGTTGSPPATDGNTVTWALLTDAAFICDLSSAPATRDDVTITISYTPSYSGVPATNAYLFNFGAGYYTYVSATNGKIRTAWNDEYDDTIDPVFVAGTTYVLEFSYKITGGATPTAYDYQISIDGVPRLNISNTTSNNIAIPTTVSVGQKDSDDNESCLGGISYFEVNNHASH